MVHGDRDGASASFVVRLRLPFSPAPPLGLHIFHAFFVPARLSAVASPAGRLARPPAAASLSHVGDQHGPGRAGHGKLATPTSVRPPPHLALARVDSVRCEQTTWHWESRAETQRHAAAIDAGRGKGVVLQVSE